MTRKWIDKLLAGVLGTLGLAALGAQLSLANAATQSPEDSPLAYVQFHNLWVSQQGKIRQITHLSRGSEVTNVQWAPDGTALLYTVSGSHMGTDYATVVYIVSGRDYQSHSLGKNFLVGPAWAPDSHHVLVGLELPQIQQSAKKGSRAHPSGSLLQVEALNLDGSVSARLGKLAYLSGCCGGGPLVEAMTQAAGNYNGTQGTLVWSTKANRLLVNNSCGNSQIAFVVPGKGSVAIKEDLSQVALSPDGSRVAGVAWIRDKQMIVVMKADGTSTQVLASSKESQFGFPVWAADGESIYYTTTRNIVTQSALLKATTQLWKVAAKGNSAPALLHSTASNGIYHLSLSRDGKVLAYAQIELSKQANGPFSVNIYKLDTASSRVWLAVKNAGQPAF